mgnify:CR=1 FL=1
MQTSNFDLNSAAVSRASGDDAGTVLGALLETPGIGLVHEFTVQKAPAPNAPGAPGLGGSGAAKQGRSATAAPSAPSAQAKDGSEAVVSEYEVFKNDNNAIAFFLSRQEAADLTGDAGPFWFSVHEGANIIAGSETAQVYLSNVSEKVIETALERGVILLIEFENQKPVRCTPCYHMHTH